MWLYSKGFTSQEYFAFRSLKFKRVIVGSYSDHCISVSGISFSRCSVVSIYFSLSDVPLGLLRLVNMDCFLTLRHTILCWVLAQYVCGISWAVSSTDICFLYFFHRFLETCHSFSSNRGTIFTIASARVIRSSTTDYIGNSDAPRNFGAGVICS